MFKMASFFMNTVVNLLRHSSIALSTIFVTSVSRALPQVGHILNWRLTHPILYQTPYSIVNWIKIRAVWKMENGDVFWHTVYK